MDLLTIGDIKRANKQAGHYFFSRDTMRAFNSIIYRNVNNQERNVFFADSSAGREEGTRDYHVRYMKWWGAETIDERKQYAGDVLAVLKATLAKL